MDNFDKLRFCVGRAYRYLRKGEMNMAVFWMKAATGMMIRAKKGK